MMHPMTDEMHVLETSTIASVTPALTRTMQA